ncbi:CoA-binding protein [Ornithinimicrobium sp. INDO-MA30-4]|uniref:CoA-binding protein n=1 Tax=Ornithinimicrobium sp. INDO-MA30-4 TaxID=2908651 RepID=UPI001F32AE1A|nr:CoA-binding protein [Ornithinimicrobium sp. INDO-MA30-4]UJH71440.1 CoA-binding protein [Ornithinimicrobium sp. INDO-MA30-4]
MANDIKIIEDLLTTEATWAVVGLSTSRHRAAYEVSAFLKDTLGHEIIPIHPRAEAVHGHEGYRTLADIPDGTTVDVVDFFVNSSKVGTLVDDAIEQHERLGIKALWLQLGVVDEDAAERARQAGLAVVMDTCPKIEWPRVAGRR